MKLSVVILNYNVRYFLELCLKSVEAAISNLDAEIIVVDNHSNDDSCQMVKSLFPGVLLIENKLNYGFSKGNNIGVNEAKGEYICILNPDTVVAEDTFTKLLDFTKNKENLGITGCKLIDGVGEFLPESKRNVPNLSSAVKKLYGNSDDYYAWHLKPQESGKVDVLVGAFMFLKQDVFHQIGGFDEDYFMYGEDIDISYKAQKSGYDNYYFADTTCIHFKGESTLFDSSYLRRFYGAMKIFYKKHFRKNLVFDALVYLGISIKFFSISQPVKQKKSVLNYILVSNKENKNLEAVLTKDLVLCPDIKAVKTGCEVIFDAHVLPYKTIIDIMEKNNQHTSITYKIWPNNSKFILGSDDAISRGEVISFD